MGWLLRPWLLLPITMVVVASPLLIYTASASPPPSPNHSPSVSVVVFVVIRCYHRLPSPMHCLIVVLLIAIVVLHRPSSIVHRPSTIVSIRRPLFAVRHRVVSPSATSPPWHRCHHQIEGLIVVYMGWRRWRSLSSTSVATAASSSSSS
jgi:hypothetical protein